MLIEKSLTDKVRIIKKSIKTEHAGLLGAFCCDDVITFDLTIPRRLGAYNAVISFYRDSDGDYIDRFFAFLGTDYATDIYSVVIPLAGLLTEGSESDIFWYSVYFESAFGKIRLSYDKYSYNPCVGYFDDEYDAWQLTVYSPRYLPPSSFKGGIFYQIFVDRFNRGSYTPHCRPDAEYEEDWYNGRLQFSDCRGGIVKNNRFFGGNLYGVAEKIDYLLSLGVTAIYLNPIFEAYSNH